MWRAGAEPLLVDMDLVADRFPTGLDEVSEETPPGAAEEQDGRAVGGDG